MSLRRLISGLDITRFTSELYFDILAFISTLSTDSFDSCLEFQLCSVELELILDKLDAETWLTPAHRTVANLVGTSCDAPSGARVEFLVKFEQLLKSADLAPSQSDLSQLYLDVVTNHMFHSIASPVCANYSLSRSVARSESCLIQTERKMVDESISTADDLISEGPDDPTDSSGLEEVDAMQRVETLPFSSSPSTVKSLGMSEGGSDILMSVIEVPDTPLFKPVDMIMKDYARFLVGQPQKGWMSQAQEITQPVKRVDVSSMADLGKPLRLRVVEFWFKLLRANYPEMCIFDTSFYETAFASHRNFCVARATGWTRSNKIDIYSKTVVGIPIRVYDASRGGVNSWCFVLLDVPDRKITAFYCPEDRRDGILWSRINLLKDWVEEEWKHAKPSRGGAAPRWAVFGDHPKLERNLADSLSGDLVCVCGIYFAAKKDLQSLHYADVRSMRDRLVLALRYGDLSPLLY